MLLTTKYDNETTHEVWFHDAVIWKRCVPKGAIDWVVRGNAPNACVIPPSKDWIKGLMGFVLKDERFEGVKAGKNHDFTVLPLGESQKEIMFHFEVEEEWEEFKGEIRQLCMGGWEKPERGDWRKRTVK